MSNIVELRDFQGKNREVFFLKEELNDLLSIYAGRVRSGDWVDYSIEQRNGIIAFSVFKNAFDAPEYTVAKCSRPPRGGAGQYLLLSGPEKLIQTDDLSEIIAHFQKQNKTVLQLVKA